MPWVLAIDVSWQIVVQILMIAHCLPHVFYLIESKDGQYDVLYVRHLRFFMMYRHVLALVHL